jgi:hypothetical protein
MLKDLSNMANYSEFEEKVKKNQTSLMVDYDIPLGLLGNNY